MKKQISGKITLLLCSLALFAFETYKAQGGLSNLSFESWTITPFGPTPTGWAAVNGSQQTTGAQQGNSYLRLSNTSSDQGTVLLGTPTAFTGDFNGGEPYTHNPAFLNGFYKTSGLVYGDTVSIFCYTSKTGTVTATGTFTQDANIGTWASFSIPFSVVQAGVPDSLFIFASSGYLFGNENSLSATLDLDNFALAAITGIDEKSIGSAFLVYPNPASSELTIVSKEEKAVSILISDRNGKRVEELPLETEKTRVELQAYESGIYFYSILDKNRRSLLSSKFIVVK